MMITIRDAAEQDIPAIFEVRTSVRENHLSTEQMPRMAKGDNPAGGRPCARVGPLSLDMSSLIERPWRSRDKLGR